MGKPMILEQGAGRGKTGLAAETSLYFALRLCVRPNRKIRVSILPQHPTAPTLALTHGPRRHKMPTR